MSSQRQATTLNYYNEKAEHYTNHNHDLEGPKQMATEFFDSLQRRCPDRAPRILEVGCGTGRDAKVFLDLGAQVDAFDGSEALVKVAREKTGLPVKHMLFEDLDLPKGAYDGVWAMASLLHVEPEKLPEVLQKLGESLVEGGRLYASFKWGQGVREADPAGRVFTDLDHDGLIALLDKFEGWTLVKDYTTEALAQQSYSVKWFNLLLEKSSPELVLKTSPSHALAEKALPISPAPTCKPGR